MPFWSKRDGGPCSVLFFAIVIVIVALLLTVVIRGIFAAEPTPVSVPTPAPTPVDAESWLTWLNEQPTVESFWLSNFEFPNGEKRPAEQVTQVPGAGCGVVSTRGYIQGPGGFWNQGFVEMEVTASLRLSPWVLFESVAYADSGKVKKSHKFQLKVEKKPQKPKKVKWDKSKEIVW